MAIYTEGKQYQLATLMVGQGEKHAYGAVSPPIYMTAQFEAGGEFSYTRGSNPTVEEMERRVAVLEGGEFGVAFASGMAAIAALIHAASRRGPIYLMPGCYAGTGRLLRSEAAAGTAAWQTLDWDSERWPRQIVGPATVWIESPTNPLLREMGIAWLRANLPAGVEIVVDNTLATPALQRPLSLGATHVVHSASKFLGGHSDVLAGVVVTDDPSTATQVRSYRTSYGACASPFSAWLVLRGIQTLAVRMTHSSGTAHALAEVLEAHAGVDEVFYPGLRPPPYRPAGQMTTGGAVVSFRLARHLCPATFMKSLAIITVAESLGGVETLLNHCVTMSNASSPEAEKAAMGLGEHVFRLSAGLEDVTDLISDINTALSRASTQGE